MAYKDEYEVGRLYTDGRFRQALAKEFAGVRSIRIHLAPPSFSSFDRKTGRHRKFAFGRWIIPVLNLLRMLRGLREGPFDIFARSAERRLERNLRDAYLQAIGEICRTLTRENLADAVQIAAAPLAVRGFGHVKAAAAEALLTRLRALTGTKARVGR
jgi:indolepyruvate ferredoxin oxidoreductase